MGKIELLDDLEGATVDFYGNKVDVLYERIGDRAKLHAVSLTDFDLDADVLAPSAVKWLEAQIEQRL